MFVKFDTLAKNAAKALLFAALLSAPAVGALAQGADMQSIADRLERLERDIRTLNQQIAGMGQAQPTALEPGAKPPAQPSQPQPTYSGGDIPEDAVERILQRLNTLEGDVRQMTGSMETVLHETDRLSARLEKLAADVDFRLSRLEGQAMGVPGSTPPAASAAPAPPPVTKLSSSVTPVTGAEPGAQQNGVLGTISATDLAANMPDDPNAPKLTEGEVQALDPQAQPQGTAQPETQTAAVAPPVQSVLPKGSIDERYRFAFNLLGQGKYAEAEAAWQEFIRVHPDNGLTDNARYWLGETYYVQKRYLDAAQAFFAAFRDAPGGAKAQDSLLKLGMSMSNLDKAEEACAAFGKLRKEFDKLRPDIEKNLNRETKRLACK